MAHTPQPTPPDDITLLHGCYLEAQRSDHLWFSLEGLRLAIQEPIHSALAMTISEIRTTARCLRHLADVAQVHRDQIQFVLNHLNTLLPCLSRSLRDLQTHYEDRSRPSRTRWQDMYCVLTDEAGGLPLPMRFATFNRYVLLLRNVLLRSFDVDLVAVESLRGEVIRLREAIGLATPSVAKPGPVMLRQTRFLYEADPTPHWAEHVFSTPLSSKTPLADVGQTKSLGPHKKMGSHNIPMNSRIYFRQCFDQDNLSLTVFNNSQNNCTYLLLRIQRDSKPWFALRGAHRLCVERHGSSLRFMRWSAKLVLMYCTFISLKAHNCLTRQFCAEELCLQGERKVFSA
ncbi:hypothetical protein E4U55_000431 [Claviceps digitariae]|nr:hypothetical protein E4U55_000431 [Claviceps digitariae]